MQVARYIGARLAQGVLVVLGAVIVSFLIANLAGNPGQAIGGNLLLPAQRQQITHQLGYDRPVLQRLGQYVSHVVHGNFGTSWRSSQSALSIVLTALPNTLILIAAALLLALCIAVPLASYSILHRDSRLDRFLRRGTMLVGALPDYWLALVLILLLSVDGHLLPSIGFNSAEALIMPSLAIGLPLVPTLARLLRGALLDVFEQDFVTALRAKGLSERQILVTHGFKNASGPFVTLLTMQLGWLIGGTIIVEVIFAWPGLGFTVDDAAVNSDITVIQAAVVVGACCYVVLNLIADVWVLAIDPRVRMGGR